MLWQEVRVKTTHATAEAVADLFHAAGCGGVVIEDPALVREYIASGYWDAYELPREAYEGDQVVVKGYLPLSEPVSACLFKLEDLKQRLAAACAGGKPDEALSFSLVEEEDWANAWKQYYKPVKVAEKLVIKPSWEDYRALPGEAVIELDPGMAFGTGTHPTTLHCLRLLERWFAEEPRQGARVFDVGTGSGILAIAAALLGAREVLALEIDPVALKVAEENVRRNRVADKVKVVKSNLLEAAEGAADIIAANLTADLLLRLIPHCREHLRPGGCLIGAGIIQQRLEEIMREISRAGFSVPETVIEGEWSSIVVRYEA